jgi:diguanylate cyclase (GGDEF)-like protein
MSNLSPNLQTDYIDSYTLLFAQRLSETIGDMTGIQFTVNKPSLKEQSFRFNNGMTVYIHFYGKVQGEFIIGIDEHAALKLTGIENSATSDITQYREDLSGFFNEVLNIASAQTLPELELVFENLTYFPAIVAFGDIIFPEVRSSMVDIVSETAIIQCGFSLNMVSAKIVRKLERMEKSLESTTKLASTDALTKMYNRTFFESVFTAYIDDTRKTNQNLSIFLIDIDLFKTVNDTYGHLVGDQVLKLVAQTIKENLRNTDIAVRYGGDEILVVLPGTDMIQAAEVAQKIHDSVGKSKVNHILDGSEIAVTTSISVGCAELNDQDNPVSFFERADANLYKAKEAGRNRVVIETSGC